MDIYVSNEINNNLFSKFVDIIKETFDGELIEKLDDGFDTKYYDFKVKNCLITLHQIPMNGITVFFTKDDDENNDNSLIIEISNALKSQNDQIQKKYMDRKQFLIKFWDRFLKPIFLLVIFVIIIKNFGQIVDIGKFLGALAGILIVAYLVVLILGYFFSEFYNNLPEKFRTFVKSLNPFFEILSYLLPILLVSYIVFNWNSISDGSKIFIIFYTFISITKFFLKKIDEKKQNDQI